MNIGRNQPFLAEDVWSGREDSNLRPLPPEDDDPAGMWQFFAAYCADGTLFTGVCSLTVPRRGSFRALNPCLRVTEINRLSVTHAGEGV